jgi:protein phosphatase
VLLTITSTATPATDLGYLLHKHPARVQEVELAFGKAHVFYPEQPGLLEHPAEAFAYFRSQGVGRVVCEEKHMGSRAVVVVCRDESVARRRFGVPGEALGACLTRTGRRFFSDDALERRLLVAVRDACEGAELWSRLDTNWACLDCELMPWSVKAQELLRTQYAAVGSAARAALGETSLVLQSATDAGVNVAGLLERTRSRQQAAGRFVDAYRRYCWNVAAVSDLKLAPFHVMATEGKVHVEAEHSWHLEVARSLAVGEGPIVETASRFVDLGSESSEAEAVAWWESLTSAGGEGMVVKPETFLARGKRGLVQPALKCRGHEYLRLIYGPEYLAPDNLERLRARGLSAKRSLALRELALGVEGLERFVRREPLRRVHECVFGVLALESEPVDPRL